MRMITVQSLSKRFETDQGGVQALKELDFEVEEGQFFTLLGPSGCGKSTTLRCVAGLERPDTGDIYIGDQLMCSVNKRVFVPPHQRNIGMVFQSYALYPHMSVFDNMAFGLSLRKTPKTEIARRVNEAAHILGIEALLKRKPGQLSGGQCNGWPWGGRLYVNQPPSYWTNPSPTWTPSYGCRHVPSLASFTSAWEPPSSTLPTTR